MQIVFVHIPKTGGTSVREALFRARPDAVNLCDYGADHASTSPLIKLLRYGPDADLRRLRDILEDKPAYTLCGHIKAGTFGPTFGAARLLTVLRDPVDRVVSNYRQCFRRREFAGSLMEFARRPDVRNAQFRFTHPYRLDQWLFVARLERLAADMAEFAQILDAPILVDRANVAPEGPAEISAAERREILALNEHDAELYESCGRQRTSAHIESAQTDARP